MSIGVVSDEETGVRKAQQTVMKKYIETKIIKSGPIIAPQVEWKQALGFPLEKIKNKFIIPEFERKLRSAQVTKIMISILNNQFYDNIIRVIRTGDRYVVIDGQHRLAALFKIHLMFGLDKYDLLIGIYPNEQEARIIYRKINSGKPLQIIDILKSFDDGHSYKFFDYFRMVCKHDKEQGYVTFFDVLNAIHYSKRTIAGSANRAITINDLQEKISDITDRERQMMLSFLGDMYEFNRNTNGYLYTSTNFRILFRLYDVYHLKRVELLKLVNIISNDMTFQTTGRTKEHIEQVYNRLAKHVERMRSG